MIEDIATDLRDDIALEDLLAMYYQLRHRVERTLDCDVESCHHQDADRAAVEAYYNRELGMICHDLVKIIEGAI